MCKRKQKYDGSGSGLNGPGDFFMIRKQEMAGEVRFFFPLELTPKPLSRPAVLGKSFFGQSHSCYHTFPKPLSDHGGSVMVPLIVRLPTCTFALACVQFAHLCCMRLTKISCCGTAVSTLTRDRSTALTLAAASDGANRVPAGSLQDWAAMSGNVPGGGMGCSLGHAKYANANRT